MFQGLELSFDAGSEMVGGRSQGTCLAGSRVLVTLILIEKEQRSGLQKLNFLVKLLNLILNFVILLLVGGQVRLFYGHLLEQTLRKIKLKQCWKRNI